MLGHQVLVSGRATGVRFVVHENPTIWQFNQQVDAAPDTSVVRAIRFDGHFDVNGAVRPALGYPSLERSGLGANGFLIHRMSHGPGGARLGRRNSRRSRPVVSSSALASSSSQRSMLLTVAGRFAATHSSSKVFPSSTSASTKPPLTPKPAPLVKPCRQKPWRRTSAFSM